MAHQDVTRKVALDDVHRLLLTGAVVEVVAGSAAGLTLDIDQAGLLVGSGPDCDVRLDDPLVSRRHLELRAEERGVRVVDCGSTNGTLIHGMLIRDVLLTSDAVLGVGDCSLQVRLTAEPLDVQLSSRRHFGDAIAHSASMRHVFALLERAAKSDVTVLLEGDSGTGKDVLAAALHSESRRADKPFVVVDCGAIPEGLVESELFGHDKGAFTGASHSRAGAFEQADGGTVFLDEIGELPLDQQPKLLRMLESRSFRRVGGNETIKVDVRVIAATNRRLRESVRRKEFREDLFYRLAVVPVRIPRLGERPDDVIPLAERFLQNIRGSDGAGDDAKIPPDLAQLLMSYPWPGNARELRNVVERFATFDRADARLLFGAQRHEPEVSGDAFANLEHLPYHDAKKSVMDAFHRAVLPRVVTRAGGSVSRAAQALGLPRASLYRMLAQLRDESDEA